MILVAFIKRTVKTAKQGGHSHIHTSMAVIYRRVNQYRFFPVIAQEITAPQISMQKPRRFGRKYIAQLLIQLFKMVTMNLLQQLTVNSQFYLWLQSLLYKKIDPVTG